MSALKGIRIIELAERPAGEYCGKLLADFGAEVIKLEAPGTGSATRRMSPLAEGVSGPEASGLFAYLNTNKRSVTLALDTPDGQKAALALIETADVVIDDNVPGRLTAMGVDVNAVVDGEGAPVICSITPFGQDAPDDRLHGEDLTVFHASSWGYHTPSGGDPAKPPLYAAGRFLPSYEAGLEAAMCISACLADRETSAKGRFIDISVREVMASRIDYVLGQMVAGDMDVGTERHLYDLGGPAGIFPCKEGYVYLWMSAPYHWKAVGELLGHPEWMKEFPDNWLERGLTPERIALVKQHLSDWLQHEDKHDVSARAQKLDLTMVPVNSAADLPHNEQLAHRRFFASVEHPSLGAAQYPTVPYKMSSTPASIERPAPVLGEGNGLIDASEGGSQ